MMPLGMFASRQFSAANLVTFVVYAALGRRLLPARRVPADLARLLADRGGRGLAAGDRADAPALGALGALAQRIGPRIPLTVGPLVIAAGLLLMTRIEPGDSYVIERAARRDRLRARADAGRRAGDRDRARRGRRPPLRDRLGDQQRGLARRRAAAVAVLPLVAGLTGDAFYDPAAMTDGFHMAMLVCAGLAAAGGLLAWATISDDVLDAEPEPRGGTPERLADDYMCPVSGAPLRPAREADCRAGVGEEARVTGS